MRKRSPFQKTAVAAAVSIGCLVTGVAQATEFTDGDLSVSFDATISAGAGWRMSDIDYEGVGPHNAAAAGETDVHKHGTSSQDNSNLRYEQGDTYTEIVKAVFDTEVNYKNFGGFLRVKGWYDYRLATNDGGSDLPTYYPTLADGSPAEPRESDSHRTEIMDAFVWGNWWLGDAPLNVRYGRQVISWGEGVFFPNGINTINGIDVNALLAPGAELKEALLPAEALFASLGVTENLSIEAFVQFNHQETRVPACGTFFSTTDLIGDGCDNGFYISTEAGVTGSDLTRLPRGEDAEVNDEGQYGFAARYYIDSIETEVAAYFINYHSKLPLLSGYMPTPSADTIANITTLFAGSLIAGGAAPATASAIATGYIATPLTGVLTADPTDIAGVRNAVLGVNPSLMAAMLPDASYFIEYPEDIQLYGVSFNTTIDIGIPGGASSVAGEISLRKDQPFQIEDGVVVGGILGFPSQLCADAPTAGDCYSQYQPGEYVQGYITEDYYQAEFSMIHFFDRLLGASRWTVVADVAFSYADIPDEDELTLNSGYNAALLTPDFTDTAWGNDLGFAAAGFALFLAGDVPDPATGKAAVMGLAPGTTLSSVLATSLASEDEFYPTQFAWGYKLRLTGEYNNVFAGINLKPSISFSHDVQGVTPGPISNFLEDRMSFSANLEAIYQHTYSVAAGYTEFFGAEPYNQLADRDFFTLSASASF
ncbi:MAG: hypothetical protein COA99_03990 [Moraxellaceae bacterium]|nr:MAG: hypothetical protein COA99_03990 [Moraxellaceae bacterium]